MNVTPEQIFKHDFNRSSPDKDFQFSGKSPG
jgi:hypothetical protein